MAPDNVQHSSCKDQLVLPGSWIVVGWDHGDPKPGVLPDWRPCPVGAKRERKNLLRLSMIMRNTTSNGRNQYQYNNY